MQSGSQARLLGHISLSDVAPLSLGIETLGDVFSIIIPKNSKVPATKTKQYTTSTNNQTEVTIKVFEGEDKVATENNLLGTFSLTGIPPGPVGREKIDVTIDVNKEGILNVTAKIISTGGNKEVRIDSQRTNLTREEIARLA